MRIPRSWVIALTVALAPPPVSLMAQDGPVVLQPIGEWETQRLDDRCVMRRAFGDTARPTILELRRIDPWNGGFQAAVRSDEFELTRAPVTAAWLPGGREAEADIPTYQRDEAGYDWVVFPHGLWDATLDSLLDSGAQGSVPAYFREDGPRRFQRQVETFEIANAFGRPITLRTGAMDGVVAGAEQCMERMLAAHGVDPRDIKRESSRAVPRHLPSQARIWNRLPGSIRTRARPSMIDFVLYLDRRGRPTSCRLSSLPADADFEAWGCDQFMKHATFGFAPGEAARPTFFKVSLLYRP
jgi:hypothetical protein